MMEINRKAQKHSYAEISKIEAQLKDSWSKRCRCLSVWWFDRWSSFCSPSKTDWRLITRYWTLVLRRVTKNIPFFVSWLYQS